MKKRTVNSIFTRILATALSTAVIITGIPATVLAEDDNIVIEVTTDSGKANDAAGSAQSAGEEAAHYVDGYTNGNDETQNVDGAIPVVNLIDNGNDDFFDDGLEALKNDLNDGSNAVENIIKRSEDEEGKGDIQKLEEAIAATIAAGGNVDALLSGVTAATTTAEGQILVTIPVYDENGQPVLELDEDGNFIIEKDENGEDLYKIDENGIKVPVYKAKTQQVDMTEKVKAILGSFYDDKTTGTDTGIKAARDSQDHAAAAGDSSKSISDRKQALSDAQDELDIARSVLEKANMNVAEAQAAKEKAQAAYDAAKAEADDALAKAEAAQEAAIKGAIKDAKVAEKALEDAQEKASILQICAESDLEELMKNEHLEKIAEAKDALEAIVKSHTDNETNFRDDDDYWAQAEKLCNEIIKYFIIDEEGSILDFGADFEVKLIQHDKDKSKATLDEEANMLTLAEKDPAPTLTLDDEWYNEEENTKAYKDENGWIHSKKTEDGEEGNRIVVKFKDKEGTEYTRYYNFQANDDGTIFVYERKFIYKTVTTLEDTTDKQDGHPEQYKNGDEVYSPGAGKTVVQVDENDKTKGIIVYDNNTRKMITPSQKDSSVKLVANGTLIKGLTEKTAYAVYDNQEKKQEEKYENGKYTISFWETAKPVYKIYDFDSKDQSFSANGCDTKEAAEAAGEKLLNDNMNFFKLSLGDRITDKRVLTREENGKWYYSIKLFANLEESEHTEPKLIEQKRYEYDAKKYDTYVPEQAAVPGVKAYTDQVGIEWLEDKESFYASPVIDIIEENNKFKAARNYDDYSYIKLAEKLKEYQDRKAQCDAALEAVNAAQDNVSVLQQRIKELKKYSYDRSKLTYLYEQLQAAEQALEDAVGTRDTLQEEVDKAKAALDGIVIPEPFVPDPDKSESGDDEPGPGSDTVTYVLPTGTDIPVIPLTALPLGAADVRTGRRTVASRGAVADAGVLGAKSETDDTTKMVSDNTAGEYNVTTASTDGSEKTLAQVGNSEVPLAATPFEEGMNLNLLWLLAASAAIIAGAVAYENHRKKVAANDESKNYKR